jgi:hypothetical protein
VGACVSLLLKDRHAAVAPPPVDHAYHYQRLGTTMLRSQLDCSDASLPGELKTFDLVCARSRASRCGIVVADDARARA